MIAMERLVFLLCLLGIYATVLKAAKTGYGEPHGQQLLRLVYEIETDPVKRELWKQQFLADNLVLPDVQFQCNVEHSEGKPTSVHQLRPSDINVVAAFGDSITAGNGLGAETAPQVAVENRGESWSIGGDETLDHGVVTLTNILRQFNPEIKGFSYCPSTQDNVKRSWLNVAEPGGDNRDMPNQARMIVNRIKEDPLIDYWADWKMATLFIGGNDLCASCRRWDQFSPEAYGEKIKEAVDILFNELPRVFLNLVPMFDVTPLSEFSNSTLCDLLQTNFCDCAVNETTKGDLRSTQMGYYQHMMMIANDPKYSYREDFAVVVQPHLRDFLPPRDPDTGDFLRGFLAPDCFHPSRLGHQFFAFELWNDLLTPVSQKPLTSTLNMGPEPNVLKCPTITQPFFFTNKNSI